LATRPQPIKQLAHDRELKDADVAVGLAVSTSSWRHVAAGRVDPWPALKARASDFFGLPEGELFHDDDAIVDAAIRLADRTRRAQGLPPNVTDVAVLERIAALIEGGPDAA